jgi:hypothetical protein
MLLDALASLPHRFSVLARETSTETITHKPIEGSDSRCSSRSCTCCNSDVWLNKVRSGLSPAERKSARWSSTSCAFCASAPLLNILRRLTSPSFELARLPPRHGPFLAPSYIFPRNPLSRSSLQRFLRLSHSRLVFLRQFADI